MKLIELAEKVGRLPGKQAERARAVVVAVVGDVQRDEKTLTDAVRIIGFQLVDLAKAYDAMRDILLEAEVE